MSDVVPISDSPEKCFVYTRGGCFVMAPGDCLRREALYEHGGAARRNSDLARAVLLAYLETDANRLEDLAIYNTAAFGPVHDALVHLPK